MKKHTNKGFTLIELLMVIAIIGILAGILIPTVGAVKKQANVAASKAQLSNYVNAMQLFKGEYSYFPLVTGTSDSDEIDLSSESLEFIKTLSARDPSSSNAGVSFGGNRRQIAFYSFSESEFLLKADGTISTDQLADRFNNTQIFIVVDTDGNGSITPSGPDAGEGTIRSSVSAYVGSNPSDASNPTYKLWD
ncbi:MULTISPECIES: type II secretion system protein [unclassified Lentimonas]|uniref:type II secretion system protein n=1 Tax=unclassified Lentimonas TaxID=2630993 RepID=UPI001FD458F4|nr:MULTISPECIES: prepilin-type N-terminal cleavage/methylation domain-containing protein [unclassified Lentimonas]